MDLIAMEEPLQDANDDNQLKSATHRLVNLGKHDYDSEDEEHNSHEAKCAELVYTIIRNLKINNIKGVRYDPLTKTVIKVYE
jgi:hypothetical protein